MITFHISHKNQTVLFDVLFYMLLLTMLLCFFFFYVFTSGQKQDKGNLWFFFSSVCHLEPESNVTVRTRNVNRVVLVCASDTPAFNNRPESSSFTHTTLIHTVHTRFWGDKKSHWLSDMYGNYLFELRFKIITTCQSCNIWENTEIWAGIPCSERP